ncbi:MAG: prepilin peptidase [Terracidiphilus sp.]|jgi:leader peptidase (prepilin peptidase)/N-methyltransferase
MIRILGTIFAGLLGLAFGSFLNVCLSRWPAGESVVTPRSHCRSCNRTLAWWENLPLVSWLALRGRCRTCRAWIGLRYPLVELAVGALWAVSASQALMLIQNFSTLDFFIPRWMEIDALHFLGNLALTWLLVALLFLDAEHLWLPDRLTLPSILVGFVYRFGDFLLHHSFSFQQPDTIPSLLATLTMQVLGILAAAGLILLIRWLYWLIRRREGIGLGDAKLMALLAAWLGLPGALLAFGLGVVLGALAAAVLLAIPAAQTETGGWALKKLPLGTFLCVGGIVSSLWGQPIIAAYLRWAGF